MSCKNCQHHALAASLSMAGACFPDRQSLGHTRPK